MGTRVWIFSQQVFLQWLEIAVIYDKPSLGIVFRIEMVYHNFDHKYSNILMQWEWLDM